MTVLIENGRRLADIRRPSRPLTLKGRSASLLPVDHPAVVKMQTIYRSTVRVAGEGRTWVLKSGSNNKKIGSEVLTGKWAGLPIFSLSLEERATCPQTCRQLRSCYGNKMDRSHRFKAGPELELCLAAEVEVLDIRHVNGFVVRSHVLGDFYSVEYVELWRRLLRQYSTLRIWGYTARIDIESDPIAAVLASVVSEFGWDRFAVRLSNASSETRSTIVVEHPDTKPQDATLCGQETEKKKNCGACALCWESEKRVAFIQH